MGQVPSLFSIAHEALAPENEIFTSATSPPQKCLATDKCIPDKRMKEANTIVNMFFILTLKHQWDKNVLNPAISDDKSSFNLTTKKSF